MWNLTAGLVVPMPILKCIEMNPEKAFLYQKAGFLSLKHLQRTMSGELTFNSVGATSADFLNPT